MEIEWKKNNKKNTFLLKWNKKIHQCRTISLGINNGGWFKGALGNKHMWSKGGLTKRHPQIRGQWHGQWFYLTSKIYFSTIFICKLIYNCTQHMQLFFFLNRIRQVACDISLHATYYTYDVHTMNIWYVCIFHQFISVQQIVY